jgi:hypothetical protein
MKNLLLWLLAGIAGILLFSWILEVSRERSRVQATSTWSYLDAVARTVTSYYEVHAQLPEELSRAVDGPAGRDFSGKPIQYRIIEKQTFELRATGTNGVIVKRYTLSGTNLIIHEASK